MCFFCFFFFFFWLSGKHIGYSPIANGGDTHRDVVKVVGLHFDACTVVSIDRRERREKIRVVVGDKWSRCGAP